MEQFCICTLSYTQANLKVAIVLLETASYYRLGYGFGGKIIACLLAYHATVEEKEHV